MADSTDALRPAFASYQAIDPAAPEGDDTLNLAWTRDERDCLAVELAAALAAELSAEVGDRLPYLNRYPVRDPYSEDTLGPAVAAAFALPSWRGQLTCGAGVVSLLHAFARLASTVRIVGDTYPDFPYWVAQSGGTCTASPGAPLWFVERPSLTGDALADLADVAALCDDAARHGAIVIADESNASYYPPAWSAVGLAHARDNLVVARGFSKAYGLGGLRLAYAVASPALTARIRTVVPPLLASSLSVRLGARVLALGDLTAPLRARIAALVAASEHLPYILSRAPAAHLAERLEARGIRGKHHPVWSAATATLATIYRLSVPLSDARLARLRALVLRSQAPGGDR